MTTLSLDAVQKLVSLLATAMANCSLYSPDHPQVMRLCIQALEKLSEIFAAREDLSLMVIDEELVAAGHPLPAGMYVDRFTRALSLRGIGHVRFLKGINSQELQSLVTTLAAHKPEETEIISLDHIRFGRVEVRFTAAAHQESRTQQMLALSDVPEEELARLLEIYEAAKQHRRLHVEGIAEIVTGFIHAFDEAAEPLLALAPVRSWDEYTYTHSSNVCILNLAQALALGIEGQLLHDIGIAAILHDVGKLYIPEEVLNKPGKLDDREWALMRQHPSLGAGYLLESPGVPRLAVVVAYEHHMRLDGTGYPSAPPGWRQNLCSQMTAISDYFDALRTRRSYREAMSMDRIGPILLEAAGTQLHPGLTRNFLEILRRLVPHPGQEKEEATGGSAGPSEKRPT